MAQSGYYRAYSDRHTPPRLMAQPHKTHSAGPEFSQTEKQADNQKKTGQTVILRYSQLTHG